MTWVSLWEDHPRGYSRTAELDSHATNIAFSSALAASGEQARQLATLSSTTFDAQLAVAGRVATESPELYFDIQALNDHGRTALDALLSAAAELAEAVDAGDAEAFRTMMHRGQAWHDQR